jgi:hypothetical protein
MINLNMFCKHEWKVLSTTTTLSQFEYAITVLSSSTAGKVTVPSQMCNTDRKHIQIFSCAKCGKLKRFVDDI